jgi:hypothetical protein
MVIKGPFARSESTRKLAVTDFRLGDVTHVETREITTKSQFKTTRNHHEMTIKPPEITIKSP